MRRCILDHGLHSNCPCVGTIRTLLGMPFCPARGRDTSPAFAAYRCPARVRAAVADPAEALLCCSAMRLASHSGDVVGFAEIEARLVPVNVPFRLCE